MAEHETCWTLIDAASKGRRSALNQFARLYQPVVESYFRSRWKTGPLKNHCEDAFQDAFYECIKPGGVLVKVESGRQGGFRAYLYGTLRHVALRYENRRQNPTLCDEPLADESSLGESFDREFARAIMKEASLTQSANAQLQGERAVRRVELLRLRFHDGLPIRKIAEQWKIDADFLHREYAYAREEFRKALTQVVKFHHPDFNAAEIDQTCRELLGILN